MPASPRTPNQCFLEDFFDRSTSTVAVIEPASTDHKSVEPISAPITVATSDGTEVRTDDDTPVALPTFDLNTLPTGTPTTAIRGTLYNLGLRVGEGVCQGSKYVGNYVGNGVIQPRGEKRMSLNERAQRGLKILADGGSAVVRVSTRAYKVKSQSGDGFYDVRKDGSLWSCTCPDATKSAQFCKHLWAVELSQKLRLAVEGDARAEGAIEPMEIAPSCGFCGSKRAVRFGARVTAKGTVQRFGCKDCGRKFIVDNGFSRLRAEPKAVVTAFDLWAKKVSYRQIAHHLKDVHGVTVGKSTIERWVRKMGERISTYADKCAPKTGDIWHADETTVNINGDLQWTWNVMDHDTRFWLASTITKSRAIADARKPLKHAQSVAQDGPAALVTDGQPSYYDAVGWELRKGGKRSKHLVIPPLRSVPTDKDHGVHPGNNICERLQGTQRERTKVMRGFDARGTAQGLVDGYRGYYNMVRPHLGVGGLTPAQAAGVAVPDFAGQGRLMSVLVAAFRESKSTATRQVDGV
jgi:transposase-like protein